LRLSSLRLSSLLSNGTCNLGPRSAVLQARGVTRGPLLHDTLSNQMHHRGHHSESLRLSPALLDMQAAAPLSRTPCSCCQPLALAVCGAAVLSAASCLTLSLALVPVLLPESGIQCHWVCASTAATTTDVFQQLTVCSTIMYINSH
jgi:hypothetical protein